MNRIYRIAPFLALAFAIVFNLILLRSELTIKSDPNDNIFQFTLVNRTNIIWQEYGCPLNLSCWTRLIDHWTPEWAEGYPLPFYYSHIPQVAIVASHKLVNFFATLFDYPGISLFEYYHFITYLILCLFPLPIFLALRVMGFSPLVQIFGALFASHISTDGLYGMDNSSYLWRGYGLTSQLFATFFMPLAIAYVFRAMIEVSPNSKGFFTGRLATDREALRYEDFKKWNIFGKWKLGIGNSGKAIIFLLATLSSHLGLGYIALLSLLPLLFLDFKIKNILTRGKRLVLIAGVTLGLLSYWIVPFWRQKNFHNISVWDPLWKFNSFGYFDVLTRFFEGELIDFGRLPILTSLTVVGFFVLLFRGNNQGGLETRNSSFALALLFPFWLLLFFGRTTWGPLMKLLPGAESFHLHRFINGLHLAVLFLAPVGMEWLVVKLKGLLATIVKKLKLTSLDTQKKLPAINLAATLAFSIAVLIPLYRQTITYAQPNAEWLEAANQRFDSEWPDFNRLINTLHQLPPGRIYAGKPGYWGKDFKIGDTQVYMALSVRGFEVSQFLPETWSPNSDTEQFFDERVKHHYDLYNIRYVVAPENIQLPDFVRLKERFGKYLLYEVKTSGYFTIGKSNSTVLAQRSTYQNIVHLWQISPLLEQKLYPTLSFTKQPVSKGFIKSLALNKPLGYATPSAAFSKEQVKAGQEYAVQATIPDDCRDCLVIAKITYHPNWQVYVDGKKKEKIIVFPFFIAIPIEPGEHQIVVHYQPSRLKIALISLTFLGTLVWLGKRFLLLRTNSIISSLL